MLIRNTLTIQYNNLEILATIVSIKSKQKPKDRSQI